MFLLAELPDTNECAVNNGGCEHTCSNTEGSYDCSCPDNYFLSSNGHNCTGMYLHVLEHHNYCRFSMHAVERPFTTSI